MESGDLWAQNWKQLLPILIDNSSDAGDASDVLRARNMSVVDMARMAEDFYVSLGFEPLPPSFWQRSQFVKPTDGRATVCHPTAANFYRRDDVRSPCAFSQTNQSIF